MKNVLVSATILGVLAFFGGVGCGEKASETTEHKVTTPGGTTTEKSETTVKKTGDNPPSTEKAP